MIYVIAMNPNIPFRSVSMSAGEISLIHFNILYNHQNTLIHNVDSNVFNILNTIA